MKYFTIACLLFIVGVQAEFEFNAQTKKCMEEINTDEETIKSLVKVNAPFPQDNELVQKLLDCVLNENANDGNEDSLLMSYAKQILRTHTGEKVLTAELTTAKA